MLNQSELYKTTTPSDQVTHIVPKVGVSPLGEEQLNYREMSPPGSTHQRSPFKLCSENSNLIATHTIIMECPLHYVH